MRPFKEMHRFWLRQLVTEFENICQDHGLGLQTPTFAISKSEVKMGEWAAATRTMSLSEKLISSYPWSTTLNVLKHEMAHQICSELFKSRGRPHGVEFSNACEILGVPHAYRSPRADLSLLAAEETGEKQLHDSAARLRSKVEKLLALAQSESEHEAVLALAKAQELVKKYNLPDRFQEQKNRYDYLIIDKKKKQIASYQKKICTILSEFFQMRVILSDLYDPLRNDTFKVIELLGEREKLAIAEYCYYFLENQLSLLWQANKKKFQSAQKKRQKNSYYLGVLDGFYCHLQAVARHGESTQVEDSSTALVSRQEKELEAFVSMRFPRLRKEGKRKIHVRRDVYEDGRETGGKLRFSQAVGGKDQKLLDV